MPRTFLKPALMAWDNHPITDHNRSELSVDVDRIGNDKRMANGTMRRYVVADKRTFGVSWNNLPGPTDKTVDGFWGGDAIENWYNTMAGAFKLTLTSAEVERNPDGTPVLGVDGKPIHIIDEYTVVMTRFSKEIVKRGAFDMLQVNVELEEV